MEERRKKHQERYDFDPTVDVCHLEKLKEKNRNL
jgi:hypothetical protein